MKRDRWWENFEDVCSYLKEHQCALSDILDDAVTRNGVAMRRWVREQRLAYYGKSKHSMPEERRTKLHDIGIEEYRDAFENAFYKALLDAKQFYEKHHHVRFPTDMKSSTGTSMKAWLNSLRLNHKKGKLSPLYLQMIRDADMLFILETPFETAYRHAAEFYRQHGSLQMPTAYICEDGFALGKWCADMRDRRKNGKVSEDRIARLDAIGFDWSTNKQKREMPPKKRPSLAEMRIEMENDSGIKNANAYYAEHQNLDVPDDHICEDGFRLGEWLSKTRRRYHKNQIPAYIVKQLDAMCFLWKKPDRRSEKKLILADYMEGIVHATKFAAEKHHLNVPKEYVCEDGFSLGKWLHSVRIKYRQNTLLPEVAEQLEKLGIIWKVREQAWMTNFSECRAYLQEHLGESIPKELRSSIGTALNYWFKQNQASYRAGTMNSEKAALFSEIDCDLKSRWRERSSEIWNINYEDVVAYLSKHPDCTLSNLPQKFLGRNKTNLRAWLYIQQKMYHGSYCTHTPEQREKLQQIGMDSWKPTNQNDEWMEQCLQLKDFYDAYGHLRIPEEQSELRKWFWTQRGIFRKGGYSAERLGFLEEIGALELFQNEIRTDTTKVCIHLERADFVVLLEQARDAGFDTVEEYLVKFIKK